MANFVFGVQFWSWSVEIYGPDLILFASLLSLFYFYLFLSWPFVCFHGLKNQTGVKIFRAICTRLLIFFYYSFFLVAFHHNI